MTNSRLNNYYRKLKHEWSMWTHRRSLQRKLDIMQGWISQQQRQPAEVLVGPNCAQFGGVRHHIHAIQQYCQSRVQLAPSDRAMQTLQIYDLETQFRDVWFAYEAAGVNVLHSHVYPWYIDWCRERKEKSGIKWVHTYHANYYPECETNGLQDWQQEINNSLIHIAPHADIRLSVSKWQVNYLRDTYGIESEYLANGVDVELSQQANPDRFRRIHELTDFVLYVGRNDSVKNPREFVQLAQHLPELNFVMIGQGLDHLALKDDWGNEVPSNVTMVGALPQQKVQDAIAASSAVVVTSRREGLPTLVMEAMANKKPIVVPDEPGCVEVTAGEECGYIYQPGNIQDLASQTRLALADSKIGSRGYQRVLKEYDWRVVGKQLDAVYRR